MASPEFYVDKVSAVPGETVRLFASSPSPQCSLEIRRIGHQSLLVERIDNIQVASHATPENADQFGCDWPVALEFKIGQDWKTGYYDLCLIAGDGTSSHHFVCVRKSRNEHKANAIIVLSTNTYVAYNYWGGANAYANVADLMAGRLDSAASREGAIARLSRMRPYAQTLICPPDVRLRLVNPTVRKMNELVTPADPALIVEHGLSPYDGAAGFIRKWEHKFVSWMEEHGYELDYLTDQDFETEKGLLADYKTAFLVGHSEYWSKNARVQFDRFTEEGGNLAVFSGNTCYWKVRWEDDGQSMVAHKCRGEEQDPYWWDPKTLPDATHVWSHPEFGLPEAKMTGLSFLYGGYHRLCMCVARGGGAYTVYDDQHWALDGTDLFYGDMIGGDLPLIGYENDGCIINFDTQGLPVGSGVGVPENLEIIAIAPATLAESERNPFPPLIPREETDVLSTIAYGRNDDETVERMMRGHAVMASFKRGEGEVFNAGTTEWVYGLEAADPFVEEITRNILRRFEVEPVE